MLSKHDGDTYRHVMRVAGLAQIWAASCMADQPEKRLVFILGCCMHDIGKLRIRGDILRKRGKLENDEWLEMKSHPSFGIELLFEHQIMHHPLLEVVMYHHERWDGKGYPVGLSGYEIPELARMCSIADAFDAMTTDRVYKRGISIDEAKRELLAQAGAQFDEYYVKQFLELPSGLLQHTPQIGLKGLLQEASRYFQ
nr:HD domain-containing phosphohydrolase [Paenibacillus hamazuiensis]